MRLCIVVTFKLKVLQLKRIIKLNLTISLSELFLNKLSKMSHQSANPKDLFRVPIYQQAPSKNATHFLGEDRRQRGREAQGEHLHQLGHRGALVRHQGDRRHRAGGGQDRGRAHGHPETVGGPEVRPHERTSRTQLAQADHHQPGDLTSCQLSHDFFPPLPYNPLSPVRSFLLLISAPTCFHDCGLVTRWGRLLITSNVYLPSTQKDKSTMRAGPMIAFYFSDICYLN